MHDTFNEEPVEWNKAFCWEMQCAMFCVFYAPISKDRGHVVLPLSVHLSGCTNLAWKLNIFPLLLNKFSYKAHIWYEGTSHRFTSPGTKFKVICRDQGQISGSCFSKDGCFRGISVSQTHLVFNKIISESIHPDYALSHLWRYIFVPKFSLGFAMIVVKHCTTSKLKQSWLKLNF